MSDKKYTKEEIRAALESVDPGLPKFLDELREAFGAKLIALHVGDIHIETVASKPRGVNVEDDARYVASLATPALREREIIRLQFVSEGGKAHATAVQYRSREILKEIANRNAAAPREN